MTTGSPVDVEIDGTVVLVITPLVGRVAVALAMPGVNRNVDVSVSPTTALLAIHNAADHAAMPRTQAEAICRRALHQAADSAEAWAGSSDTDLSSRLGGACFPLLASAYSAGATGIDDIPRWAAPVLVHRTAREAGATAFGVKASRPVISALAGSLVRSPDTPADLSRLALAMIGAKVLAPDKLADILALESIPWTVRQIPSRRMLQDGQDVALRYWGAARTARVLTQAGTIDHGRELLFRSITFAVDLGPHAPTRLPHKLNDLHDLYRSLVASEVNPTRIRGSREPMPRGRQAQVRQPRRRGPVGRGTDDGPPRVQRGARRVAAERAPTVDGDRPVAQVEEQIDDRVWMELVGAYDPTAQQNPAQEQFADAPVDYGLRYAPDVSNTTDITSSTPTMRPSWVRNIDGATFGQFRVVLPRTCGDLVRWSKLLRNCLDTYCRAAAAGQSILIGVEREGILTYVVEVTPQRQLRQFCGIANRRPSRVDHDTVHDFLAGNLVIR